MKTSEELDKLLRTPAGIERIVTDQWKEEDNLDFKREINRRDPKWENDLRGDCAALSSTGVGFLLIGVDDSRDGNNKAVAIVPVKDPSDLKNAIENRLATGLSPPLRRWEVWIVETQQGPVVVVRVEGEVGHPVEVLALSERRHFLRGAAKNQRLHPEDARIRRRALDLVAERKRHTKQQRKMLIGFLLLIVLITSSIASFYFWNLKKENQLAVDASMCGFVKRDGGAPFIDNYVWPLKVSADVAILQNNATKCSHLLSQLLQAHPEHVWRHYWQGQCERINNNLQRAQNLFLLSEEIATRAITKRPNCERFKILRALSLYASNHQPEACSLLKTLHKDGLRYSRDGHPPMPRAAIFCPDMATELSELGLATPRTKTQSDDSMLWPVDNEQRSKILKRVAETNYYDLKLCLKSFPPSSKKIQMHYVINQAGNIEDLGPAEQISTAADEFYVDCQIEISRHWQFPPHKVEPSVDLSFPIHFEPCTASDC